MDRIKYIKSKYMKNTHFYECCKCGLDIKPYMVEQILNPHCKCGEQFTREEIREAKDKYIEKLEKKLEENNIV